MPMPAALQTPEPGHASRVTPPAPRRCAAVPPARVRPDFFIVGAPKCGTTAMSDYLAGHPDIFMARKEMHFFGGDLRFAPHFYRRAEPEYLAEFDAWDGQRRRGEASVWYLFSETAAAEIKAFNPSARILVLLREPVEMMYSLFNYFRFDGNEPLATFQEALAAEPDRRAGRRLGRQTHFAPGLVYHDVPRFATQLQRYFKVFGRERVRVVLHEDLAANPAAVYRDTLEFLEVDSSHTLPMFERVNPAKTVRNRVLRAALNDPAVRSALLAIRPALPRPVFYGLHRVERLLNRFNSSVERPPPLELAIQARLRREFAPEVQQLSELLDRDLTHWTRETAPAQPSGAPAARHGSMTSCQIGETRPAQTPAEEIPVA
jgi:hypothetical protein